MRLHSFNYRIIGLVTAAIILLALSNYFQRAVAQPFMPDAHTLLLLHFDGNLTSIDGKSPLQASGLTFENGIFGQGVRIMNSATLRYSTTGNFNPGEGTIEFWIKPTWVGNDDSARIFFAIADQLTIVKDGANNLRFLLKVDDSEAYQAYNLAGWTPNGWHHVAVTWTVPGYMKTYIDGVERISNTSTIQDLITTIPPLLNIGTWDSTVQVNAVIDELRMSDIARSPVEIAASFIAGITVMSLSIQPDSLRLYPTWTWTPTLIGTTNFGIVNFPAAAAMWSSTNPAIAMVDTSGQLTASSPGNVTLTATVKGTQGALSVSVMAPVWPPDFGPIDSFLITPAPQCIDTLPVVIIRYLPTTDGTNLDVSFDPDYYGLGPISLSDLKNTIDAYDKRVKFMLEEGSRFHGYMDSTARPSIGYKVAEYITVYEPTPPGLVISTIKNHPIFMPDFEQIFKRFNIENYVNNLGVKEIWFWSSGVDPGYPSYDSSLHRPENLRGDWESNMSSPITGDISNSSRNPNDLPIYEKTYIVYGANFRRTQAEAVHNHGHQLEAMLSYVNIRQDGNSDLFWKKFVGQDQAGNFITGRCGWTHMPPNTTTDYDYQNPTLVLSDIENWSPDGTGQRKLVNDLTWGNIQYHWPDGQTPPQQIESQWYIYWMQNMPGSGNMIRDGSNYLTNWWQFTADWDSAIIRGAGLYSKAPPSVILSDSVSEQWNLLSLPLKLSDYRTSVLYPTATSGAFIYQGSYFLKDTLSNRIGFWLRFNQGQTASYTGSIITTDSFDVVGGWNLIGSISQPVPISSITTDSSGVMTSKFWGYKDGYMKSDTIFPGKGYWIYVNRHCHLFLSSTPSGNALTKHSINIVLENELPPPPPDGSAEPVVGILKAFVLEQNYPNPFNPTTTIRYGLPEAVHVKLTVYNVVGEQVAVLVNEVQDKGYRAAVFDGAQLASGVYWYRLEAGNNIGTMKSILLK